MRYVRLKQPMLVPSPKLFLETSKGERVYLEKAVTHKADLVLELARGIARANYGGTHVGDDSGIGEMDEVQDTIVEEDGGGRLVISAGIVLSPGLDELLTNGRTRLGAPIPEAELGLDVIHCVCPAITSPETVSYYLCMHSCADCTRCNTYVRARRN